MTPNELRQAYLNFFKSKGHVIIPSAFLVPENDPTTLFTGSGMQPMLPYFLSEKHPLGQRLTDSQKCFRAQDIEEVGDSRHTTFFEMLGNWSLDDYFKKEQIQWMFEFLTKTVGLDPKRLYVTVFRGNEKFGIPRDVEAVEFWKKEFLSVGVEANDVDFSENDGLQNGRIFYYDEKKNWWSRVGVPDNMPIGEPGGPDSEMFWDFGAEKMIHENSLFKDRPCHVNCDCGRFVEIGNNVFMEYKKTANGFEELPNGNIDFGGGFERILAAKNDDPDIFKTEIFLPVINKIEELSGKKYNDYKKEFQIITDHVRAATMMINDGVLLSNKDRGYILRRLIRRAVRYGRSLEINKTFLAELSVVVVKDLGEVYPELTKNAPGVYEALTAEEEKFNKTLEKGLREFEKMFKRDQKIDGEEAFVLYSTYGFPIELTEELAKEKGQAVHREQFAAEFKKHQNLSRAGAEQKFAGGLADHSETTTKLHTTTHLLQAALRQVLGPQVFQRGSNITTERLRFDFSQPEKLTPEQLKAVEDFVNEAISKNLPVVCQMMSVAEAKAAGAIGVFDDKYKKLGGQVKVYTIGLPETPASREVCGGPHVEDTGYLGHFKIIKEEAVSAGIRRIKAILE